MKYGVTAPPEEANRQFIGIFSNVPERAEKGKEVRRRDELMVKCSQMEDAIRREKESTELLMSRLTLHLTKLRRQARLQADLQDCGVANKIRKAFNEERTIAELLQAVVNPSRAKDRLKAKELIDHILASGKVPTESSKRRHQRRIWSTHVKTIEEQITTDVPNVEHRRAMVPNLADRNQIESTKLGIRVKPRQAAKGVEVGDTPGGKYGKLCIKTGYMTGDVLGKPEPTEKAKEKPGGKKIVGKGVKRMHFHHAVHLPPSVFDNTDEGYAIRHAIADIDNRSKMRKLPAHTIFNTTRPPPPPVLDHPPVKVQYQPECLSPKPLVPRPPPAPPAAVDARRAQCLSGSHNVLPLGL